MKANYSLPFKTKHNIHKVPVRLITASYRGQPKCLPRANKVGRQCLLQCIIIILSNNGRLPLASFQIKISIGLFCLFCLDCIAVTLMKAVWSFAKQKVSLCFKYSLDQFTGCEYNFCVHNIYNFSSRYRRNSQLPKIVT